ncbi:glycosyltransferase family 1 protein [Actinomadura craniellae]|uniref:Glycosyltransferase family 1 protein n=1 Tax=Actinomadura craniellae TaxID=2231787 RepID=A0A365H9B8_9ACTN|nr:glycosyltransferase [Actinomadura craniellae]RAY15671.1 glycosyltransferase family 1 protein [Actinomadura craniellae]
MSAPRPRVAVVLGRFADGPGVVALNGMLALDPRAYERVLVTGAPAGPGDLSARADAAGVEIVRVPGLTSPADAPRALRELTRVLAAGRYDVVHTHDGRDGLLGRFAAARAGVPRIVHTWHRPPGGSRSWLRRRTRIALERRAARHTHAFLAVGSRTAARATLLGLAPPDRIRLSWPAVDLAEYAGHRGGRARARRRLDLPLGVRVMGSVGRLTARKDPELFVRALARLPEDVFGLWAGDGPLAGRLRGLTERLGLADRMRWLGHRGDVPELLPAFDVMVLPGRSAGLPCALVEAIAAGVPLVATAVPSHPDLVRPGETGLLVRPRDRAGLAAAVGHLLDHPAAARRMTEQARVLVGEWFTPEHLGSVLDAIYRGDYPPVP